MEYLKRLEEDLRPMTELVRLRLEELETDIRVHERELKEMRAARTRLTTLMRQIDPESVPKQNSKPKASYGISQERYQQFLSWLQESRERLNEQGFYAKGLLKDPAFTIIDNQSQINKALVRAHDEGITQLYGTGQGGRKIYKVI